MNSPVHTQSAIQGLNWTQIAGSASQLVMAPDGQLWALSTLPSGPDKYIWQYDSVDGAAAAWTNVSGLASQLAAAPDGTIYAVNSSGGTYHYAVPFGGTGAWTALGGGASAVTVAWDGSIYVLSNGGSGTDKAIWHNVNGTWSQVPGSGIALAAAWDPGGPYNLGAGVLQPRGFYILNSAGQIWYENGDGTFARLPGSASSIAPAGRGVFALGYPGNAAGNAIYYNDFDSAGWTSQPGAATGIATADTNMYVLGASGSIYTTPILPQASSLVVRGLWVQFEQRSYQNGFYDGDLLHQFDGYQSIVGRSVRSEVALQLDKMRAMGVNTIEFELRAADSAYVPGFTPPTCNVPPVLGLQYPQPTSPELSSLTALFDLVQSKGIKIILNLVNTHMEEQPPANNTAWLSAILQTVKNHPALYMVLFDGDVHVNNFNNTPSCGIPAEPPLWLGSNGQPAQYVKWAIGFANTLGIPFAKLSAETIVGSYIDENSPNLTSPIVVMKGIFDGLNVPDAQRTYAVSFYEHKKCQYAQGLVCTDEDPNAWANETMQYIYSTIGHNGAHAVAVEFGDATPVDPTWPTATATDSLLTLMEKYGMDGGCFWRWASFDGNEDFDQTLADPVIHRGVSFTYNPVEAVLAKHYTAP